MKRYRKARPLPEWKAWRNMLAMQLKSNRIVNLYDQIVTMGLQGFTPQAKSPRAILRQAKKRGIIVFKKK